MDTKSVHGLGEVPVEPYKSWDQVPFVADGEDSYMGGSVERVIGRHGIFTGQPCVRKTIQLREIEEDKMKAAEDDFRKELKILGYARHHHVVTLVMAYALQTEKDKRLAIIMDHAEGGDLGNYLTNPQMIKKNLNNIAQWFSCLSSAVTYIHGIGIRHRDIKPANILVHDGKIRLSDFGISKMGLGRTLSTTIPEWARGRTEKYCAPEVEDGSSRGRSGDIFSLGAVFLEMLVAHSYFNQRSGLMGALAAIGGPSYAKKLAEVREWMDNLEREMNCGPDDWRRKILCLCREMLHEERDKRPEAFRLENELSSFQLSKGCPAPCTCTGNETLTNDFMLVEASKRGDRKTVASLLANNSASPNAVGALHQASIHNHPYVVRALLRYQGNVNLLDHSKQTPLHCAASYGNGEIVDILLNNEARATFRDDGGQTALHCVAGDGNGEIVQMLLDRGDADIMAKDSKDQTALHFAARRGHEEVVKILLDRGADRNWADREGRTALHFAAGYGSTEVVEMLLEGPCEGENPVNVNVQDNYKWSALHFAVRGKRAGGRYENVIEKLIGRGADVRMKDGEGLMALMHAKMNNYDKRAKLLEDALDKA
jgi:ankyrin repeat protein